MPTNGYQAAVESNDVEISFAKEVTYGVLPSVAFQKIRTTGESFATSNERARPAELNARGEVQAAVTQRVTAGGQLNFALSFGTYDDWLAALLNGDWQAAVAINGIGGDITITAGTNKLTSTLGTKFQAISAGQWIRLGGFTNAANNGIYRVASKASGSDLTLTPIGLPFVTETPAGTAAKVRASTLMNGVAVTTLYVQRKMAADMFFREPGTYLSAGQLSGGTGQFLNGSFTGQSKDEVSATAEASTGAAAEAPTGAVHDSVDGFGGFCIDGALWGDDVDQFSLSLTKTGAAQTYAMGSPAAKGQVRGLLEAGGSVSMLFDSLNAYERFKAGTKGALSFILYDDARNAYVITLENATLQNPRVNAGGPSTSVMAQFDLEGNPRAGVGGTVRIDRLPVV
ncbi:phage tail tube protein [Roseomonas sp. USHLN139]|uniref:phage tail tube protein n=1 Tax=Roseomonas sp. USHLN139 TaxID=3081298 RepID=UPI003B0299FE